MIEFDYQKAAGLDPLDIDADLFCLPEYNAKTNTVMTRHLAAKAVRNFCELNIVDSEGAYATLRDLDFIASSLDRQGVNPMAEVDGLERAMTRAGRMGDSVPRGTITTYAGINPDGERRRTYSGSQEEKVFIDSLEISFCTLELALNSLARLTATSRTEDLGDALAASVLGIRTMTDSTIMVMRNVPPHIFTNQIRPYFEPLTIGGVSYAAANGSQLQLGAIEKMVYGTNKVGSVEYEFFEENKPYLNASQRDRLQTFAEATGGRSVVDIIRAGCEEGDDVQDVLPLLLSLAKAMRKFRYPHRKVAEDNFSLRPDGSVGSGSYAPAILTDLIRGNEVRIERVEEMHV